MTIVDLDLIKEFERLLAEGGNPCADIELEPRYNCDQGYHQWKKYVGFTAVYHYCLLCDLKDTKLPILK